MAKKPPKKIFTKGEIAGLKKRALKLWHADSIGKNSHAMALGLALIAVRDALRGQHGEFKKWWQDYRLEQSRVSYCMDLAAGKLAKRKTKAKAKSAEQERIEQATHVVGRKLNQLFLACAHRADDGHTVDSIPRMFKDIMGETFKHAAALAGWKLDSPEVKKAASEYAQALATLISTVSGPTVSSPTAASVTAEQRLKSTAANASA